MQPHPAAPRQATAFTSVLTAPNPGPMTLDGTNTWVLREPGARRSVVVDPGPSDQAHLDALVPSLHLQPLVELSQPPVERARVAADQGIQGVRQGEDDVVVAGRHRVVDLARTGPTYFLCVLSAGLALAAEWEGYERLAREAGLNGRRTRFDVPAQAFSAMSWPAVVSGRTYANWMTTESSETVTWVALLKVGLAVGGTAGRVVRR